MTASPAPAAPPPDDLVAAWTAAEAAWTEPAAHDRAAALAVQHGALPWLARRYREVQEARPDDAIARARLEKLAVMSVAALRATAAVPPSPRRKRGALVVVLVIIAVVLGALLLVARATSRKAEPERRRPAIPGARSGPARPPSPPAPSPPAPAPAPSPSPSPSIVPTVPTR